MKVPIRTLSARDVEILARSSVTATASKGYVERHGLRWKSHALLEWELKQRNLRRDRKVELLIDELDLSAVFVILPEEGGNAPVKLRAVSTKPAYTKDLSLFEHEKLKAVLREKNLVSRLDRMADRDLYEMRQEYYALLGRQKDPISARKLEKLRDQLAERRLARIGETYDVTPVMTTPELAERSPEPEALPVARAKASGSPRALSKGEEATCDRGAEAPDGNPGAALERSPDLNETARPQPLDATPPAAATAADKSPRTPTYPVRRIKRKHR